MKWYLTVLNRDQVTEGAVDALQKEFGKLFLILGAPAQMSVMAGEVRRDEDFACPIYFSPRAGDLAPGLVKKYGAKPCEPPTGKEVANLIGGDGAILDGLE